MFVYSNETWQYVWCIVVCPVYRPNSNMKYNYLPIFFLLLYCRIRSDILRLIIVYTVGKVALDVTVFVFTVLIDFFVDL